MTRRPERVVVHWADEINEQGLAMRWFGSWLHGDGTEDTWFYSGFGNETTQHDVPDGISGVRIRKWVSEGLDPEYVDVPFQQLDERDGAAQVLTGSLDFDTPQPHRVLVVSNA